MKRYAPFAFAALFATSGIAASAQSSPVPAPSAAAPSAPAMPSAAPASVAPVDPAITARAKEWYHRLQTANIDRAQLSTQADAAFSDAVVKQLAAQIAPLGDPKEFSFFDRRFAGANTAYLYKLTFASTSLYFVFSLDAAGKISGLYLKPVS